jgi:hypothetical protein
LLPLLLPLPEPLDDPLLEPLPASAPPLEPPLDDPLDDPLEPLPASAPPLLLPPDEVGASHFPAVHRPVQQSLPVEQSDPFDVHVAPMHLPARQLWLQHCVLAVQALVSGSHVGASQTLLVHEPPQQSLPWSHPPPVGAHGSTTHLPELQSLLQQSLGPLQVAPVTPHTETTPLDGDTDPGASLPDTTSSGAVEQAATRATAAARVRRMEERVISTHMATRVPRCGQMRVQCFHRLARPARWGEGDPCWIMHLGSSEPRGTPPVAVTPGG